MRKLLFVLTALAAVVLGAGAPLADQVGDRLGRLERESYQDRIDFTGELRFEAHNLHYGFDDYFDGMRLQNLVAGTMFYFQRNFDGQNPMTGFPPDVQAVQDEIAGSYGDWRYFADHLTFDQLGRFLSGFDPQSQQQLMRMLMPAVARRGYEVDNDILYTTRLRLDMAADVMKDVTFSGRLSMYKTWGDNTGVQVFNGQSNSFIVDGNDANVPNGDVVRVERAFFTWKHVLETPLYLSIGRRPSTGGPPLHLREDEKRAGSPLGTLIDMQFDGITVGWSPADWSTVRLCYGLGYESQYGNGVLSRNPLKDAQFLGVNWDVYDDEATLVQTTVARGFDLTDGFDGLVVLPDNPVTGEPVGAPVVMRFTPSANVGDVTLAGLLAMRRVGRFDLFGSFQYMRSDPNDVTTPFGGLFSDPFQTSEAQDGTMAYLGARYGFNEERTHVGLEFNHGSEYWFNFTPAQDDIIAPKTNTRGDVWEAYVTHRIGRRFIARLGYIDYRYDYSGSGWHLGAPKKLDEMPLLGYPTYSDAQALSLSLMARF